jgi:adenylate kinase
MNIVLLGAPGSGKGTQGEKIVARYELCHISTGDVLRGEVAEGTPLGLEAKKIMDAGQLVSDDIMLGMVRERLQKPDVEGGFMLDGFPRTLAQAEGLDNILKLLGKPLSGVLFFDVSYDEIMSRLLARKRADDNEETIRKRLEVYEAQTAPLIVHYRSQDKLCQVEGVGDPDEIFSRIVAELDTLD